MQLKTAAVDICKHDVVLLVNGMHLKKACRCFLASMLQWLHRFLDVESEISAPFFRKWLNSNIHK